VIKIRNTADSMDLIWEIKNMDTVVIIPARAGSKGLENKNMMKIGGLSLVAHTVLYGSRTGCDVALTTNITLWAKYDNSIATYGLKTIARPECLCQDDTSIDMVLRHAVERLKPDSYEYVALLYPNVVRKPGILKACIDKIKETGCDSVQTVTEVSEQHPFFMHTKNKDDQIHKLIYNQVYRRQELPKYYYVDGAAAVVKTEVLMEANTSDDPHAFWGTDRRCVVQQQGDSINIDTQHDYEMAVDYMARLTSGK